MATEESNGAGYTTVRRKLSSRRTWAAYLGLVVLAVCGQLVFNQAVATVGQSAGNHWTLLTTGFDFIGIWLVDHAFLHGAHVVHWYGAGISNAWPPPHEVLLAPFGLLDYDPAHVATVVVTILLIVFGLSLWSRQLMPSAPLTGNRRAWSSSSWLSPLLISAPVLGLIWIDQLQAALGLAALSTAIWAQRRDKWWLVGIASAIGMIRVLNAIPVICILLLGGWGRWRQLGVALGSAAAFMTPLLFISYLWDHRVVADYIGGLSAYPYNAAPKLAITSFGLWGLAVLLVAASTCAVWLVRRDAGRPLDPGRAALGMSLTVFVAPVGGLYPAIFALPALLRLGQRPGFAAIPWIGAVASWAAILALSPWLLGPQPWWALTFVSFMDYGLVLLAYPILRNPPEAAIAKAA